MVRNFKGVVRVADVQEEFDNLINPINAAIDRYNSSLDYDEIDYNNAGPELAPMNYTLSIGGLKTVFDAYDGAILGANVLRTGTNNFIVSEGIYIKDRQVYRLPSKAISGTGDMLYYDPNSRTYTFDSEASGKLYPNLLGEVVIPAGTYPATVFDGAQIQNIDLEIEEEVHANSALTNITTNRMQTSNCVMTTYATFSQQYDFDSLTPDCFLDPTSPQYGDVYTSNVQGVADSDRANFVETIPIDTNFGSRVVYGIKLDFTFTELPNVSQSFNLTVQASGYATFKPFNHWKLQAFAYDENGTLLKTSNISTGGAYSSGVYLSDVPSNTRKITICALAQTYMGILADACGNLYSSACLIKTSNATAMDYVNLDVDCCLEYDSVYDDYYIVNYSEGYNNLLGSAHFTENTNTLEYIQLDHGGTPVGNIFISKLNTNRISRLCNTKNALNEDIPGYTLKLESNSAGFGSAGIFNNSEKGQFYSGSAGRNCRINLFDTQIAYHQWHGDRNDSYWEPYTYMFIPKGISNPYNGLSGETRYACQRVWNYILNRPSTQ